MDLPNAFCDDCPKADKTDKLASNARLVMRQAYPNNWYLSSIPLDALTDRAGLF